MHQCWPVRAGGRRRTAVVDGTQRRAGRGAARRWRRNRGTGNAASPRRLEFGCGLRGRRAPRGDLGFRPFSSTAGKPRRECGATGRRTMAVRTVSTFVFECVRRAAAPTCVSRARARTTASHCHIETTRILEAWAGGHAGSGRPLNFGDSPLLLPRRFPRPRERFIRGSARCHLLTGGMWRGRGHRLCADDRSDASDSLLGRARAPGFPI